jgi:hypothetical protein
VFDPLVVLRHRRDARRDLERHIRGMHAALHLLDHATRELAADSSRHDVAVAAVAVSSATAQLALTVVAVATAAGRLEAVVRLMDEGMIDPPPAGPW